ncbi:unnamed protein product, partial [Citrullus colocynthis]
MVTQSNQSQTSDETHEDPPEDSLTEANSGRKQHRQRQSEMEKGIAQRERKRERERENFSHKLPGERGEGKNLGREQEASVTNSIGWATILGKLCIDTKARLRDCLVAAEQAFFL